MTSSGLMARALAVALLAAPACGDTASGNEEWTPVIRGDLMLEVDVGGLLRATRSAPLSAPDDSEDHDFKIARMATEGAAVKKGTPVLWFDSSEMDRDMIEREADTEEAAKEIERKAQDMELDRKQGELRVIEAEAKAKKARLKADLPPQYVSEVEVKLAQIDLESAEAELHMAKKRFQHSQKLNEAELAFLRERHSRFKSRLDRLKASVDKMAVSAPIDGVVVYRSNWRGEKKKVGDQCWMGEACLEVTDTTEMEARAEVDELESARVRVGQVARLRLEALPETEWTGKVVSLRPNVYRQSPRTPLKVVGLIIKLEKTDSSRMRPGMQFRGRLETEKVPAVLLLPIETVFTNPEGPVVFRKTATGFEKVKVDLGRRSRTQVEVKGGVNEHDRVARRDLEELTL